MVQANTPYPSVTTAGNVCVFSRPETRTKEFEKRFWSMVSSDSARIGGSKDDSIASSLGNESGETPSSNGLATTQVDYLTANTNRSSFNTWWSQFRGNSVSNEVLRSKAVERCVETHRQAGLNVPNSFDHCLEPRSYHQLSPQKQPTVSCAGTISNSWI
uniref:Uncharacterized protein n=1 Tax=Grammatophora oceanica TaxID=210454 RepID=A0A7S1UXB9_9STRA|mmetsp:Transcript_25100/g.36757  ORF Transcript_25100/g.36757 Transcript_25100/m.36757 type:complete len:159 (+) Transcript_25100:201-677(+)